VSGPGAHPRDAEELLFNAPCCAGEGHTVRQGGSHINVVQLDRLATWPFMTAINVLVAKSRDYPLAAAVVCDRCLETKADIKYAMKGEPGPDGEPVYTRVPLAELEKPEFYWPDHHPDHFRGAS